MATMVAVLMSVHGAQISESSMTWLFHMCWDLQWCLHGPVCDFLPGQSVLSVSTEAVVAFGALECCVIVG